MNQLAERLRGLQAGLESVIARTRRSPGIDVTLLDLVTDDARGLLALMPTERRTREARRDDDPAEPVCRLLRGVLLAVNHAEHVPPSLGLETLRRACDAVKRRAERALTEPDGPTLAA